MCAYKHENLKMFGLKLKKESNFQPFEVVGRCSETQLKVGGNLNKLPWMDQG